MMARRSFLGFAAALAGALGLAGCNEGGGSIPPRRFKLTLTVDAPDGVKTASGVIELQLNRVIFPERGGITHRLKGEAVYLDLGPGRRPLVALLTSSRPTTPGEEPKYWSQDGGPTTDYFLRLYGETQPVGGFLDKEMRLRGYRGAREIPPEALPDLVTFADVNDPKSVMKVDPENLEAALGPGVKWKNITLEITDEPMTTGIKEKLPWLKGLGGSLAHPEAKIRTTNELGDILSAWNFQQGVR